MRNNAAAVDFAEANRKAGKDLTWIITPQNWPAPNQADRELLSVTAGILADAANYRGNEHLCRDADTVPTSGRLPLTLV